MDDRRIEQRLRRVRLAAPDPALREGLIAEAERRMSRRRMPVPQWALAAAAGLLIAANLAFGHVHDVRMTALVGEPAMTVAESDAGAWAQAFAERRRLMSEMLAEPQINPDGGESDEARPDRDRQTRRPWGRPAAWA